MQSEIQERLKMSIKEFLVLLIVCIAWGLHFVVMKVTVGSTAPPLFYAAVRMTIVMIILLPKLKWHRGIMPYVLAAGLGYGALNYAFMFPAMGMTTAAAAAITIELYVPFSIILGVIFLGDRIGIRRICGIILAIMGVTVIALAKPDETAGPLFLMGIFLMMGAAMSEAVGAVLVKKIKGVSPFQLLAWFAVVGTVVLWTLTLLLEDNQMQSFAPENRINFVLALLYSAVIASIVAHASYYWLLQRLPIYVVSTSGLMTTVVAIAAGHFLLGEAITPQLLLGATLTLLGIAFILYARAKNAAAAPNSPITEI